MKSILNLSIAAVVLGALAGCGQKGPLYLPANPAQISTVPPPPSSTPVKETANPASK